MSERESGVGAFVLGVAVGLVAGLLLAPERGEEFRGRLGRRLRQLRAAAADATDERRGRLRGSEARDPDA